MADNDRHGARGAPDPTRGPRDYQPDWRCQDCGAVFDEYPDRCPECGHESFRAIER